MPLPVIEELLEDSSTLREAHAEYLRIIKKLRKEDPFASAVADGFMQGSSLTIERLRSALSAPDRPLLRECTWQPKQIYVFIGQSPNAFYVLRRGDESAVVFDHTLLMTIVFFVFCTGYDCNDKNLSHLCAFLFMVIVLSEEKVLRDHVKPLIQYMGQLNPAVFEDLLGTVADIILLHEIGHLYCEQNGTEFLRLSFSVPSYVAGGGGQVVETRLHENGFVYNIANHSDGSPGHLLLHPKFKLWERELGPDTFAVLAHALVVGKVYSRHSAIEAVADAYATWQLVFNVLGYRQDVDRHLFSSREMGDSQHPIAAVRADVALFHINTLIGEIDDDYRSPALGRSQMYYRRLWTPKFHAAITRAVNYFIGQARQATSHPHLFVPAGGKPPGIYEAFIWLALWPVLAVCDGYRELGEHHGKRAFLDAISERQRGWNEFFENCRDADGTVFDELAGSIRELEIRFVSEARA